MPQRLKTAELPSTSTVQRRAGEHGATAPRAAAARRGRPESKT